MIARLLGTMVFAALAYAAIFIGPALYLTGDPWWTRGWVAVTALVVLQTAGGLWLAKADPGLLKDRTGMRPQSSRDKAASAVLLLSISVWAVMIPVDVVRLRLLPTTHPDASLAVGGVLFALGATLNIWVMKVNSFGATTVKVQEDWGNTLWIPDPTQSFAIPCTVRS